MNQSDIFNPVKKPLLPALIAVFVVCMGVFWASLTPALFPSDWTAWAAGNQARYWMMIGATAIGSGIALLASLVSLQNPLKSFGVNLLLTGFFVTVGLHLAWERVGSLNPEGWPAAQEISVVCQKTGVALCVVGGILAAISLFIYVISSLPAPIGKNRGRLLTVTGVLIVLVTAGMEVALWKGWSGWNKFPLGNLKQWDPAKWAIGLTLICALGWVAYLSAQAGRNWGAKIGERIETSFSARKQEGKVAVVGLVLLLTTTAMHLLQSHWGYACGGLAVFIGALFLRSVFSPGHSKEQMEPADVPAAHWVLQKVGLGSSTAQLAIVGLEWVAAIWLFRGLNMTQGGVWSGILADFGWCIVWNVALFFFLRYRIEKEDILKINLVPLFTTITCLFMLFKFAIVGIASLLLWTAPDVKRGEEATERSDKIVAAVFSLEQPWKQVFSGIIRPLPSALVAEDSDLTNKNNNRAIEHDLTIKKPETTKPFELETPVLKKPEDVDKLINPPPNDNVKESGSGPRSIDLSKAYRPALGTMLFCSAFFGNDYGLHIGMYLLFGYGIALIGSYCSGLRRNTAAQETSDKLIILMNETLQELLNKKQDIENRLEKLRKDLAAKRSLYSQKQLDPAWHNYLMPKIGDLAGKIEELDQLEIEVLAKLRDSQNAAKLLGMAAGNIPQPDSDHEPGESGSANPLPQRVAGKRESFAQTETLDQIMASHLAGVRDQLSVLGLLGTVVGLSGAIYSASASGSGSKLFKGIPPEMSAQLGTAFFTTLVALSLRMILFFYLSRKSLTNDDARQLLYKVSTSGGSH